MKNVNKIINNNPKKSHGNLEKDYYHKYHYVDHSEVFSGVSLRNMIENTNYVINKHKAAIPIHYHFEKKDIKIKDKLTYILTECFFYELITNQNRNVRIFWEPDDEITTNGVFKSSLIHLNKNYSKSSFLEKFEKDFDFENHHFRAIFNLEDNLDDVYNISKIHSEINLFLNLFNLSTDSKRNLSKVCIELIENSLTHAYSDCLIDIDITGSHSKIENDKVLDGDYYGINIVVINFSDKILPTDVQNKIKNSNFQGQEYQDIKTAYNHHKNFFDDNYKEECFWCLSAMQKGISGRGIEYSGGGTGLYVLLDSLIQKSDMDNCYMISGRTFIPFHSDLLVENNNLISFNREKDFINYIPDERNFQECAIHMPGTAYNLNFIMKNEGDAYHERN